MASGRAALDIENPGSDFCYWGTVASYTVGSREGRGLNRLPPFTADRGPGYSLGGPLRAWWAEQHPRPHLLDARSPPVVMTTDVPRHQCPLG